MRCLKSYSAGRDAGAEAKAEAEAETVLLHFDDIATR